MYSPNVAFIALLKLTCHSLTNLIKFYSLAMFLLSFWCVGKVKLFPFFLADLVCG